MNYKKFCEYMTDLIYNYVLEVTDQDLKVGERFISRGSVQPKKLESAVKDALPNMKLAIGTGTTDETARSQYDLYREINPYTKLTWRDFKVDPVYRPKVYKREKMTETKQRDRVTKGIQSYAKKNEDSLRRRIYREVKNNISKLKGDYEEPTTKTLPEQAAIPGAALAATMANLALDEVGLDNEVRSGGVAQVSSIVAGNVYNYMKDNKYRPGNADQWWEAVYDQHKKNAPSKEREQARRLMQFSS